ncbi:MAG: iron ABC transporter permease [Paracoccaceae bacterium]|nr:iron ABC transporter permease [Paracoccaceae bacterium]
MDPNLRLARPLPALSGFLDIWSLIALSVVIVVLFPIVAVFWMALFPSEPIWLHLLSTVLPRYLFNSALLMVTVGVITGIMGTVAAWLVVMCSFPGRRVFEWALLLPLAVPAYIAAYALVDFWEYAGPAQTGLRQLFGWTSPSDYWFPAVRSRLGAILALSFSLYPYVYLLARAAFRDQSANALEVARTLGCGPWGRFFRVAIPLARPSIFGGLAIVMMETLNDFGAVDYFAVQTLTTGIFTTWLEASNRGGAAQIASLILIVVLVLVLSERSSRRRIRFYQASRKQRQSSSMPLRGLGACGAVVACGFPVLLGFVMPVSIIISHALVRAELWMEPSLWTAAVNSCLVSLSAGFLTVATAVLLVYGIRVSFKEGIATLAPLTTIGYAAPGVVLGLGVLIPVAALDHAVADAVLAVVGVDPGLLITGSGAAVVLACSIRFFALAFAATDSAFGRLSPSLGDAARSLGKSATGTLWRIYLPLVRGSLLTAGLLVFVDSVKELPATLLLRPFGFDTLATRTYNYASLENITGASSAALMVVLVGLASVVVLAVVSSGPTPNPETR